MCLVWGWGLWWIFGLSMIITGGALSGEWDILLSSDLIQNFLAFWSYRELSLEFIGYFLIVCLLYVGVFGSIIVSVLYCLIRRLRSSVVAIVMGIAMGIWGTQIMIALLIGFAVFVALSFFFNGGDGDNWIGYIHDGFIHFFKF